MKLIKKWKKHILWIFSIICIAGRLLTVNAEESIDKTYAYTIDKIDLTGAFFQDDNKNNIIPISSFSLQTYNNMKLSLDTVNEKHIIAGKIVVTVNTDLEWQRCYLSAIPEVSFTRPVSGLFNNNTETLQPILKNERTEIAAFSESITIGSWTDNDTGIKYCTEYELEINNQSKSNFGDRIASIDGFETTLDQQTSTINFKCCI